MLTVLMKIILHCFPPSCSKPAIVSLNPKTKAACTEVAVKVRNGFKKN